MGSRNTPSSPCPTSRHWHVELLQTFPLNFLLRTALHHGSKQPFQYLALNLLCILLLLFSVLPSASTPFTFLLFDTLSPISTVLPLSDFYFIFFLLFMLLFHKKREIFHSSPIPVTQRWAGDQAGSIAPVWLRRERTRVLRLCGFPRSNIGAGPTIYSKRTAVLMQVQQGEGHLFFQVTYNNQSGSSDVSLVWEIA